MKIRRFLLCLCISSYIFVMGGCSFSENVGENSHAFRAVPFRAEIEGSVNGISFAAVVEHRDGEDSVTYLRPNTLVGITLSVSETGAFLKREGEEHSAVEKEAVAGLLSPLDALLSQKEILRLQKIEGETHLTYTDGGILTLSRAGVPVKYVSDPLSFTVVWWESGENAP